MKFTFVDEPPAHKRGRNALYEEFAEALIARPGEWAIYPRELKTRAAAFSTAGNIRRGQLKNFPAGEFEARAADGKVYVRYIGGAE